jgi:carboxyl-terminal processing protease
MIKSRRRAARIGMMVSLLLAACVMTQRATLAQQKGAAPAPAAQDDPAIVFDYADRITRLVETGKLDELSRLDIPVTNTQTTKLKGWTSEYLSQIQQQEKQRDQQYNDEVKQAQEQFKAQHFDKAMAHVVRGYRIAKDPNDFLKLDWVKDMTAKIAARAADLEKQGQWIESLELYSDLNTLYEIDTTYKADMQRLARRTRLLAVYTPQTLFDMRKALSEKEKDETATAPGTKPADNPDDAPPAFTRWQDYSDGITLSMMRRAIDDSEENWVEETSYDTLVKGGVEALRLFLTTPELSKVFPDLASDQARKDFDDALNGALALHAGHVSSDDIETIVSGLIDSSNKSIKLPKEVVIMEFTEGAMEKLDPFTAVIWPHDVPEFNKNMNGKFGGVGIQISLEGGQLKVISPLEDTPAFRAGIEAGDVITAIDGKSTVGISVDQAVASITGLPDTPVTLKIKRGDKSEHDVVIKRAIIKVVSVKGVERDKADPTRWNFMLDPTNKIGYIRITGFQEETPDELEAAIKELNKEGMRGLVLDLRFNPGGLLQAAVDMCDDFLQDGVIVSTRGRLGSRARSQDWHAHISTLIPMNMPMVVLVNEYSASASEIFSGAMKDLHRGLIVGHRTFGKGSVQNLLNIGNNIRPDGLPEAEMKLTMAYYYLPNGESLHRRDGKKDWGVDPDVVVDLTPDQLSDLLKQKRDSDIIRPTGADNTPATDTTKPAATTEAPVVDTQLETAILMMRLQLVQSHT